MSNSNSKSPIDLVPIAKVVKPKGLKGELKVFLYNKSSDTLNDKYEDEEYLQKNYGVPNYLDALDIEKYSDIISDVHSILEWVLRINATI